MNGNTKRHIFALALTVVMALVVVAPAGRASAEKNPNPGILPPSAKPFGASYGTWSNRWWQWAYSNSVVHGQEQDNPLFDTTGASCRANQSGPVFYLAGIFEVANGARPAADPIDRTDCIVPPGKGLFFPILNTEEDNAWNPANDETEIRGYLTTYLALMHDMSASIDGVDVRNLSDYVVGANNSLTTITMPANNLYDYYGVPVAPGTYSLMSSAGYYLMLAPLSVGSHTIHFAGSIGDGFSLDVTYHLTVR